MKIQTVEPNIDQLKDIYRLYDEAVEHINSVCQKKCASCCTCNVTLTSLETEFIIASLSRQEKINVENRMTSYFPEKRYIPKMTTNMFARLCAQGKEIPEEENNPSWGKCPLLVNDMCSIYDVRPFGCRALMSQVQCSQKGYAQIPPFVLTLNNIILQYIEQLDEKGFLGNLSDMLTLLLSGTPIKKKSDRQNKPHNNKFLLNEKIFVLMVPPEHQEKAGPLLENLSRL